MKKFLFMLMLTALTATFGAFDSNAQITMVTSNGATTGQDTLDNAETLYWTTPINSLNSATSGKYRITMNIANMTGTSTFKVITQGTIDGTNWFNMHGIPGTDGVNCDTLQVTAAVPAVWSFNLTPGSVHTYAIAANGFTVGQSFYSGTGRVTRLRLKVVGTGTQTTKINNVKCLVQL